MAVLYAVVTILLIAADQMVKTWAVAVLAGTDGITVIPHVLKFVYVENRGIAFGMFQNLHCNYDCVHCFGGFLPQKEKNACRLVASFGCCGRGGQYYR